MVLPIDVKFIDREQPPFAQGCDQAARLTAVRSADQPTKSSRSVLGAFCGLLWWPLYAAIREAYNKQAYPLGYSRALDGLRGLMTVGIMTRHIQYSSVPGGLAFMDFFYVASGFYITGLLLRDLKTHGRVQFGKFYRRRFARILPPFAAMVIAFLIFGFLFSSNFHSAVVDASIGFSYVANWWRAFRWPGIWYMGHTWSLAVEEQFYLLWPLTLLLLFRCFGLGWRMVASIMTLALSIYAWRCWLTWHGAPFWRLYNGFDTRADGLMMGCALAVALNLLPPDYWPNFERFLKKLVWPVSIFAIYFFLFFRADQTKQFYYYAGISVGSGLAVVLIVILLRPLDTVLHRFLERREFVFLGRIFYAIYLWHFPIILAMKEQHWPTWMQAAVGYPLVFGLATLSYALIERHFMRTKTPEKAAVADQISDSATLPALLPSSR